MIDYRYNSIEGRIELYIEKLTKGDTFLASDVSVKCKCGSTSSASRYIGWRDDVQKLKRGVFVKL